MTAVLLVPPDVERQIRSIDAWWRSHRTSSPDLFVEELSAAFELIAGAPAAGRRYPHPEVKDVRRVLLRSARFHVYYKARPSAVVVLAVWSAVRGAGPDLKNSS